MWLKGDTSWIYDEKWVPDSCCLCEILLGELDEGDVDSSKVILCLYSLKRETEDVGFLFFFFSRNVNFGRAQLIHANSVCFSSGRRCRSMLGRQRHGLCFEEGSL